MQPLGLEALAQNPAPHSEPPPVPLVSRKLNLWGLYGYSAPAAGSQPGTGAATPAAAPSAAPSAAPAPAPATAPATGAAPAPVAPVAATAAPQRSPVQAASRSRRSGASKEWNFTVGLGAGVKPDYEGSDNYEPIPLWFGRAVREDNISVSVMGVKASANLVPDSIFQAGPIINYDFGRDDVDNNRVDDLNDVDGTVELGAYVTVELDVADGPAVWGGTLEGLQGTGGGHSGFLANAKLFYKSPLGKSWRVGVSGDFTWASEDYMSEFFGIDAADSARSGLDRFDADADFKDIGLGFDANYSFNKRWGAGLLAKYTLLLGDAEDSPVVDDEGSRNQFFGGVFGSYRF